MGITNMKINQILLTGIFLLTLLDFASCLKLGYNSYKNVLISRRKLKLIKDGRCLGTGTYKRAILGGATYRRVMKLTTYPCNSGSARFKMWPKIFNGKLAYTIWDGASVIDLKDSST